VLTRYWLKGRLTKATLLWTLFGQGFAIVFIAFGSQTFLAFSSKFGVGTGFSEFALSVILAFILVGLLQSGFSGSGLPVRSADVDYVFTAPVRPREIFGAKLIITSLTTVLFSFPPMLFLYLRLAIYSQTSLWSAVPAGLATLLFLVTGLIMSADVTISLSSTLGPRLKLLRNILVVGVAAVAVVPVVLLIPGAPSWLTPTSKILPSGLAADLSIQLVNGAPWGPGLVFDAIALVTWFAVSLLLGIRMSRGHFYEVLNVYGGDSSVGSSGGKTPNLLQTTGRSIWSVVRNKETVVMRRTKERRGQIVSSLFLAAFMIIYSLAGVFQSSPTSFLFILFIIGTFGSGNANGWLEKEQFWIVRTSAIEIRKYVRAVYRARVTPLLLFLTPVTVAVGVPLVLGRLGQPSSFAVLLALPAALEVAAVMMGGGIYFAARYGQSTADDIMTSQAQQLTDIKRFLYQTVVNLALVSPLMGLVLLSAQPPYFISFTGAPLAAVSFVVSLVYTFVLLSYLLNASGDWIGKREDL
jgi:Putative ABC exporter